MGLPLSAAEIKSVKDAEAAFLKAHKELLAFAEKASQEITEASKLSTETKAALEKLSDMANAEFDKLALLEAKVNYRGGARDHAAVSVGKQFVDSASCKSLMDGSAKQARVSFKNIVNATGQNQPLVPSDRRAGIIAEPNRVLRVRDLIPTMRTSSNLIEYTKELVFTNSAASQYEASPERFEGVKKAKSNITFVLTSTPVVTIAHYMKASKQVLSDAPGLESYINGRLQYGLKLEEEEQILNGTGGSGELNGLLAQATAYNRGGTGDTRIDTLRKAITQGQLSNYSMEAVLLNPADWEQIELTKGEDGHYIWARPESVLGTRIWSLPVVPSNTIAAGQWMVGSFSMGAELWDREDAAVQVGYENDDFTRNMVTLLGEERVALAVIRPAAFIKGTF